MLTSQYGVIYNPATNSDGQTVVDIKSMADGSLIRGVVIGDMPANQSLPTGGGSCLCSFIRDGHYNTKILKIWASSPANTTLLFPGESTSQSSGGSQILLDSAGGLGLTSGDSRTTQISDTTQGHRVESTELEFVTLYGTMIRLLSDGTIEVLQPPKNNPLSVQTAIVITPDGVVHIDSPSVLLGPGATNNVQSKLFGNTVTSGINGTYPFDFMTGLPIPGSNSVLGAK